MIDLDFRKKKFVLNYDVTQFKVDFLNDFVGIHAAQFDFVYIIIMMVRFVKITIAIWGGKEICPNATNIYYIIFLFGMREVENLLRYNNSNDNNVWYYNALSLI